MDPEMLRNYCLSKPGATEDLPFGPDTLVFKVCDKLFALVDIEKFESVNLKCDPELAIELREQYKEVKPGYHMNKRHWNTVDLQSGLPDSLIFEWIDHSYDRVVEGLPASKRRQIPD
ncbi:MAG: MmcQ/YjbR family DNA-binding protein [Flavobacteriales bacterium]|nr:MmcQ/YjbR family DNA-binding protein [Flavobacteriales bacterium]